MVRKVLNHKCFFSNLHFIFKKGRWYSYEIIKECSLYEISFILRPETQDLLLGVSRDWSVSTHFDTYLLYIYIYFQNKFVFFFSMLCKQMKPRSRIVAENSKTINLFSERWSSISFSVREEKTFFLLNALYYVNTGRLWYAGNSLYTTYTASPLYIIV